MSDNKKIKVVIDGIELSKIYYEFQENHDLEYLYSNKSSIQKVAKVLLNREYNNSIDFSKGFLKEYDAMTNVIPIFMIIKLCIDFYTFDEEGRTLIDDVDYDELMKIYMLFGGEPITTSEYPSTIWPIEKHTAPFMVGSIKKTYDENELWDYLNLFNTNNTNFMLMPKFDGISTCLKIENEKISLNL